MVEINALYQVPPPDAQYNAPISVIMDSPNDWVAIGTRTNIVWYTLDTFIRIGSAQLPASGISNLLLVYYIQNNPQLLDHKHDVETRTQNLIQRANGESSSVEF